MTTSQLPACKVRRMKPRFCDSQKKRKGVQLGRQQQGDAVLEPFELAIAERQVAGIGADPQLGGLGFQPM